MSILSAIYGGIAFALSHYLPSTDRKLYSSFVGSFVFICNEYLQEGSFVQSIANPLQFGMKEYFIFYCCKIASLKILDSILIKKWGGSPRGKLTLDTFDWLCLSTSSVLETIFSLNIINLCVKNENILWSLKDVGLLSFVVPIPLIFILDDIMYAQLHYMLHNKHFYPYVHKQHHKQYYPYRGYDDAGNEHPLEQILGQILVYISIVFVSSHIKIHVLSILIQFILYAFFAITNHLPKKLETRMIGFLYQNKLHEIHHAKQSVNFSQNCPVWDIFMGTYLADTNIDS